MTVVRGAGAPVTLVAHGLGASVAETRPLLAGVPGTRVFAEARGHGRPWSGTAGYQLLADDLLAEADAHGATQALGVSLGAGALLRLAAQHPARFARLVLVLPAALDHVDQPVVRRAARLADALAARDAAAVEALVRSEVPAGLAGASVEAHVRARTAFLLASDLVPLLQALPHDVPVPDPAALGAVTAEVLVVAQPDDPVHPAAVARRVAEALPRSRLVVLDRPGGLLGDREGLLGPVRVHLAGPSGPIPGDRPGDAPGRDTPRE